MPWSASCAYPTGVRFSTMGFRWSCRLVWRLLLDTIRGDCQSKAPLDHQPDAIRRTMRNEFPPERFFVSPVFWSAEPFVCLKGSKSVERLRARHAPFVRLWSC